MIIISISKLSETSMLIFSELDLPWRNFNLILTEESGVTLTLDTTSLNFDLLVRGSFNYSLLWSINIITPYDKGSVLTTRFCIILCEHDGDIRGLCNNL